jgi:hypothetical protein
MFLNTLYIKLNQFFFGLNIFGLVYFLFNESLEHICIYFGFSVVFQLLAYIVFYKINSIFVKVNFIFFYFGYLLTMPIIFINKDKYQEVGWSGIGSYDFSYNQTFEALSVVSLYLIIFVLISYLFDKIFINLYSLDKIRLNFQLTKINKYRNIGIALLSFQLYLSYIMFQHQIGIVGIHPEENLPFRIAGILYYYRYLIIPIISFIILFTNTSKSYILVMIIILLEIGISGIFSASRSIVILHSLPLIGYLIIQKKRNVLVFVLIYVVIILSFATISRNLIFNIENFKNIDLFNLVEFVLSSEKFDFEYLFSMIGTIIVRFQGFHEFFATYFSSLSYVNTNLFLHSSLGFSSLDFGTFDSTRDIFGVIVAPDKAYAMPIDIISNLYLSSQNLFEIVLLILIWCFLLIFSERIINVIFFKYKKNPFFIVILHLYMLFGLIQFSVKMNFFMIPIILLIMNIIYIYLIPKKVINSKEYISAE